MKCIEFATVLQCNRKWAHFQHCLHKIFQLHWNKQLQDISSILDPGFLICKLQEEKALISSLFEQIALFRHDLHFNTEPFALKVYVCACMAIHDLSYQISTLAGPEKLSSSTHLYKNICINKHSYSWVAVMKCKLYGCKPRTLVTMESTFFVITIYLGVLTSAHFIVTRQIHHFSTLYCSLCINVCVVI